MEYSLFTVIGCQDKDDIVDVRIRVKNVDDAEYLFISMQGLESKLLEFKNLEVGVISDYQSYDSRYFPDTYLAITSIDTTNYIVDGVMVGSGIQNGSYTLEFDNGQTIRFIKD